MKNTKFALFVVAMFLLSPLYQVVSADVVEETRILQIEADQNANVTYSSVLNIMNNTTNQRFTNFNQLVEPFISATGIDGGYAGSFLPPARFQLNATELSTPTPTQNSNFVMSSVVEFKKKNLLTGSSESWWRCPFWFNHSTNSNFDMELKIYHVDLPRMVNLTFQTGDNTVPVPTAESHPSLVFERTYFGSGNTRDDSQYYTEDYINIPINDTWNSSKANLMTASEIAWLEETEGWNGTGDFEYYQTYNYSFIWVNVTAPIYPNESYMVVWNLYDIVIPASDVGACWVTATDIGRNEYGRTMLSWNNQNVYEIPIDLDCSVIFRTGMGDGVTGTNLSYNNPDEIDHTSTFLNPSFEATTWGLESNFTFPFSTSGWLTQVSSSLWFWVHRNSSLNNVQFEANRTGGLSQGITGDWGRLYVDFTTTPLPAEGETMKIDLNMIGARGYKNVNSGLVSHNAQVGFRFAKDSGEGSHLYLTITRRRAVKVDGSVVTDNYVGWLDSSSVTQRIALPDTLSQRLFVSIQNDEGQDETYLFIYDQDLPEIPIFGLPITDKSSVVSAPGDDTFSIYCAVDDEIGLSGSVGHWDSSPTNIDAGVIMEIDKITLVDRTSTLGWTITNPSAQPSISKHDFKEGFEAIVPEHNPLTVGKNVKCIGWNGGDGYAGGSYGLDQTQALAVPGRRWFMSCYYQMRLNDTSNPANLRVRVGIHGWTGSAWVNEYNWGNARDNTWHKIGAGHLTGTFTTIKISLYVFSGAVEMSQVFFDNVKVFSIKNQAWNKSEFYQLIDQSELNATNYLTFMMPFRHSEEPVFPPFVSIQFKTASGGTTGTTQRSLPNDFYNDFIIFSIINTDVPANAVYVKMSLVSFGNSTTEYTYLFLHDRNSDFYLNNATDTKFNYFEKKDTGNVQISETFFSPYYSLKATAGEWTNADSIFTTTKFYFVRVHMVRSIGNDYDVISVKIFDVNLQDFEVFRFNMGQFGEVYDAEDWLLYMEIRNRPSLWDMIVDFFAGLFRWLAETPVGQLLMAFGKFIYDALTFLVDLIQTLAHIILEAVQFIISVVIYFVATWVMWKFVNFWILVGEGDVEAGLDEIASVTSRTTAVLSSIKGKVF